jgi:hypothetical protein
MAVRNIQWYPIARELKTFLANYTYSDGTHLFEYLTDYNNLKISIGSMNAGEFPAINILFDEESNTDLQKNINGALVQLWIDIYVSGTENDTENIDKSLANQLYRTEKDLINTLDDFSNFLKDTLNIAVNMKIQGILSDGGENYPVSAMNRIVLEIEWRK